MVYPEGSMSLALFLRIINELPRSTVIVPFFRGESLMHPLFTVFMDWLRNWKFKQVQLATNADYLTPQNQKAILDTCSFVSVSLHSFTYPKGTKYLPFLYDALGKGIETQVSILESLVPPDKKKKFVREWKKHVNRVRIYKEHSKDGFGCMGLTQPTEACTKPFEEMVVYWNGKVGLCNHDWNNSVALGDLNVQSIEDVWADVPYQSVRLMHKAEIRINVPTCKDCDFQSNKIYGELIKVGRPR
jgi:radical SAM protein with 4Fe4S-binding SPASM domain